MTVDLEHTEFPSDDPRLDWAPTHDPRSLNYRLEEVQPAEVDKTPKRWRIGPILDQGREGACVGFAWTQDAVSTPRPDPNADAERGNAYAREAYRVFQRHDPWPGEDYEGTSVLAGAKVMAMRGVFATYRWATSIEEIRKRLTLPAQDGGGPVVIGIPWMYSMYFPRPSGLVNIEGKMVGGHAIVLDEYHPGKRLRGEDWHDRFEVFGFPNSWGEDYGVGGRAYLRAEDLRDLLANWGEACAAVDRGFFRLP